MSKWLVLEGVTDQFVKNRYMVFLNQAPDKHGTYKACSAGDKYVFALDHFTLQYLTIRGDLAGRPCV